MGEIPNSVEVLDRLRRNCHLGKHKHFEASQRGRRYHLWCGVPIMVISVILGSAFFVQIETELLKSVSWVGAGLGLTAALLSGIQTFFNFRKEYEDHRAAGNSYLHLARDCERLTALYFDEQLPLPELAEKLEELDKRYAEITRKAESASTNAADFKKAEYRLDVKEVAQPSLLRRKREELSQGTGAFVAQAD